MAETVPEPTPSRSPRVLVVDDERSIVDFIRLGLQYEGFQVQTAPDGQTALRLISEFKPHVVVLDIMMPRLDGLAVAEAIRGNKDTGIIILSAKDEVQDPIKGLPRDRILDQVWGYNFFGDANNVEVYIRYLRQKLGDEQHQLIQTVRGVGYRIKG